MRLSPLSFNLNNQIRNTKTQNNTKQANVVMTKTLAYPAIQFGAEFSPGIMAALDLKPKLPTEESLKYGLSEEVVKQIDAFVNNETMSNEIKSKLLFQAAKKVFKLYQSFNSGASVKFNDISLFLSHCPEETQVAILTDFDCIQGVLNVEKTISSFLDLAPDDETKKAMLLAKDEHGDTLLHKWHDVEKNKALLEEYKEYPDVLREVLTTENESGSTPIKSCNAICSIDMFFAAPDNETAKEILLTKKCHDYVLSQALSLKCNVSKEGFEERLLDIIMDDTTTSHEALQLITNYKKFVKDGYNEAIIAAMERELM